MSNQTNGNVNGYTNGAVKQKVLRVGLIGCGEIAQVAHIPTLNHLSDYFLITYLCDVSRQALDHCARKVAGHTPKVTTSAEELCASSEVDCVLVCNATPFHPAHGVLALKHDKHVLIEKPLALCYRDIEALSTAEKESKGTVFVGYMRRYAPAFLDAIAEIGSTADIQYVRVRDIIGPNSVFVEQSGTFPKKFSDFPKEDVDELAAKDTDMMTQALLEEFAVPMNTDTRLMLAVLGGLGTHDLSAMREIIGTPRSVIGASMGIPMWSALFQYDGFTALYESGINGVADFDAHIEVYMNTKIVRISYDSPYVKGLPTTMTVREQKPGPRGELSYEERTVRTTYEDAYTLEMKEWHDCIVSGRTPKTTVADAREDLDIFRMLMQSGYGKAVATAA